MNILYTQAIETRAAWLRWAQPFGEGERMWRELDFADAIPSYRDVLTRADTFYMDAHFCRLVDHARRSVPDNMPFDPSWMHSPCGWIWLETPFECPTLEAEKGERVLIRAVGWRQIPEGTPVQNFAGQKKHLAPPGCIQFLCFQDFSLFQPGTVGFGCWSYFMINPGMELTSRIDEFEALCEYNDGRYTQDDPGRMHELHEIRWIYAAMYLMAQKFAVAVEHKPDRAIVRRAKRESRPAPPWFRVITLRRLAQDRERAVGSRDVGWNWQWEVRGHWRLQPYPSKGVSRWKFIEAYIKGPEGKPLKEGTSKLFAAVR